MKSLVLYYFEECPYCRKVIQHIQENKIEVIYKNIRKDDAAREELLTVGGKTQVPCLFIDGKPMYESGDIISWLNTNNS